MDEQLLVLLSEIVGSQDEIHLMNIYKGLPLSFPATVVEASEGGLRVRTDRYQVVCMYIEKESFLRSERLPQVLRAKVIELDPARQTAMLAGFEPVPSGVGSRMQIRVQPEGLLEGSLQNPPGGSPLRGELADISRDGLGIFLDTVDFLPENFFIGAPVSVTLTLPGVFEAGPRNTGPLSHEQPIERFDRENVRFSPVASPSKGSSMPQKGGSLSRPEVSIHGTIANTRREGNPDRYRVGLRILPNDLSRPLIEQLIAQRQAEIIREIKVLYELLMQNS